MSSSDNNTQSDSSISHIRKPIEEDNWDSIAHMAMTFNVEFEQENKETKKLKKEIAIVKHILYEHLKDPEQSGKFINGSFFITLVRCIDKFEHAFEKHKSREKSFVIFLKALLKRIKTEKILVHKPAERAVEFKKMKDVVENFKDHEVREICPEDKLIENGHSALYNPPKNGHNGHST